MKIQSIQSSFPKATFKGKMVDAIGVGNLSYDSSWHKNSSIETTIGKYHNDSKLKAYYADPLEVVSDNIKRNVDYIVYDNEPSFPDVHQAVSKNYFGTERKNYGLEYQELCDYYDRREKSGRADIETLHKKNIAKECLDTYNQGNNCRLEKEKAEDSIKTLTSEKESLMNSLENTKKELADQEKIHETISKHIEGLESAKQTKDFQENASQMFEISQEKIQAKDAKELEYKKYQNTTETYQDILDTKKHSQENSAKIFRNIKASCSKTIKEMKQYIGRIENSIAIVDNKLKEKNQLVNDCKKNLIPLFDKLKNIYSQNANHIARKFY